MAAPFTLDSLPPEMQQALISRNPYAAPPTDPREAAIAGLLQGGNEAIQDFIPDIPDWRLTTILPEDIKESLGIRSTAPPPPAATTPQGQSQQEWQAGIEAQRQAALAKHGAPQGRPMGPSPEQLAEVAAARKAGNTPAMQKADERRGEAQANIGPNAREFAPGQFYSGPESVARYKDDQGRTVMGAGGADNFSNRPGTAPLRNAGKGTLSYAGIRDEEGNPKEILPSNPRARRDVMLERAQQNAAIAQAEATEEAYKQNRQAEPKSPLEQTIEGYLASTVSQAQTVITDPGSTDAEVAAAQQALIDAYRTAAQILNRINIDQPVFGYPGVGTAE